MSGYDLIAFAGLAAVIVGIALFSLPVALIVGGLAVIGVAVLGYTGGDD